MQMGVGILAAALREAPLQLLRMLLQRRHGMMRLLPIFTMRLVLRVLPVPKDPGHRSTTAAALTEGAVAMVTTGIAAYTSDALVKVTAAV